MQYFSQLLLLLRYGADVIQLASIYKCLYTCFSCLMLSDIETSNNEYTVKDTLPILNSMNETEEKHRRNGASKKLLCVVASFKNISQC